MMITNGSPWLCTLTCGLQIMFNIDRAHMILDEMIMNGHIVETNKSRILAPIAVLDKSSR